VLGGSRLTQVAEPSGRLLVVDDVPWAGVDRPPRPGGRARPRRRRLGSPQDHHLGGRAADGVAWWKRPQGPCGRSGELLDPKLVHRRERGVGWRTRCNGRPNGVSGAPPRRAGPDQRPSARPTRKRREPRWPSPPTCAARRSAPRSGRGAPGLAPASAPTGPIHDVAAPPAKPKGHHAGADPDLQDRAITRWEVSVDVGGVLLPATLPAAGLVVVLSELIELGHGTRLARSQPPRSGRTDTGGGLGAGPLPLGYVSIGDGWWTARGRTRRGERVGLRRSGDPPL